MRSPFISACVLLMILAIQSSVTGYAQTIEDLKGRWEGVHYYGDTTRLYNGTLVVRASTIDSMKMILTIDKLEQGKFQGHLHEHFYGDPKSAYFTATVSGMVRNDSIIFDGFTIKENRLPRGNRWCKPKAVGFIVKHETFFALNMSFESTLTCTVGPAILERDIVNETRVTTPPVPDSVPLERSEIVVSPRHLSDSGNIVTNFKSRTSAIISTINVRSDSIQVRFIDNGTIDGDSISVFVNGELHTAHILLSTTPFTMNLQFEAGNELEVAMFAENLGTIPPNTAVMQIIDGAKVHQAYLSSDTRKNAVVKIRRSK